MDKNIAALLRNDAKTVKVRFPRTTDEDAPRTSRTMSATGSNAPWNDGILMSEKAYTYVTNIDLAVGDYVVVGSAGRYAIARVDSVDNDVQIEPNADRAISWVIDKIDLRAYADNMRRNADLEAVVAEGYRNNIRRSFAQQFMLGVEGEQRNRLQALMGVTAPAPNAAENGNA